jgi:CubicO group peptidase (beta-lactamase class C family)
MHPLRAIVAAAEMLCAVFAFSVTAKGRPDSATIDAYLQPYVSSGNFSGVVLVRKSGETMLEKAYGFANQEEALPNTTNTRFHIASLSMQFTAAAIMRLVDAGVISLEDRVGGFVPGTPGADKITIRHLLTQRSGLSDINSLPDYQKILQHHQSPADLVARIDGLPLLFEPGTRFLREEHSAYNLLALIIEKKSGQPFAAALEELVFAPASLRETGIDDDSRPHEKPMAVGYEPEGSFGLKPARTIHWSAKSGNASAFATASDEARWVDTLFGGHLLSDSSRRAILEDTVRVGYGWFKVHKPRFGETAFYMNGRAPGFASFVLYLPEVQTTVVVLSNVYSSAVTSIGYDIAALALGLPYERFQIRDPGPTATELKSCEGRFRFGSDFYQPDADVRLITNGTELFLHWPSGDVSALIPVALDRFVDRSYWEDVRIGRTATGKPDTLCYGEFRGTAATTSGQ